MGVCGEKIELRESESGFTLFIDDDGDFARALAEIDQLLVQSGELAKVRCVSVNTGWREVTREEMEALVALLARCGVRILGVVSMSLNARNVASSLGYRTLIGRVGLAEHIGHGSTKSAVAPEPGVQASVSSPLTAPAANVPVASTASGPVASVASGPATSVPVASAPVAPGTSGAVAPVGGGHAPGHISGGSDAEGVRVVAMPHEVSEGTLPSLANLPPAMDSIDLSDDEEPSRALYQFDAAGLGGEPTILIRRTVRSGQHIKYAGNVVVVGDVNPGASVEAEGDVIVLGILRGQAHAGCAGNVKSMVMATCWQPTQVRIAERILVSPLSSGKRSYNARKATIIDDTICVEPCAD